ncbi:hypothetical protein KP509_04G105600 [Ceratopteris richardii]|uniref:Synaptonemal complex protein 1 n=3 Tax=Ceratopteris richardii TaxID=49495 RepID=A0A8T2V7X3_CERRI|nr:hypothetical protein KP509_04G105600 [Ceratopteris richardii]
MAKTAALGSGNFKGCLQRSGILVKKCEVRPSEGLTQLKLTAEKMLQEQASVKTDLQVTYSKLEKSEQEVQLLETRLQEIKDENGMLRVKQLEAVKLWEGLESKFTSTKTFCNQLMETLQHLALQVQEVERGKQVLEEKLVERSRFYQEIKLQVEDLSAKKRNTEKIADNWKMEYGDLAKLHEQTKNTLSQEIGRLEQLEFEKETHLRTSNEMLQQERQKLNYAESQLCQLQNEVKEKMRELDEAQTEINAVKKEKETQLEMINVTLQSFRNRNDELEQDLRAVLSKCNDLEVNSIMSKENVNELSAALEKCKELMEQERNVKLETLKNLKAVESEHEKFVNFKTALGKHVNDLESEVHMLKDENEAPTMQNTSIIQELRFSCKQMHDLAKEKLELVQISQHLQSTLDALSATAMELISRRDHLVMENSSLHLEIQVVKSNAESVVEEKLCEIEKLTTMTAKNREVLSAQEAEIAFLRQSLLEKEQVMGGLLDEQKQLKRQCSEAIDQKLSAEKHCEEICKLAETQLETKLMELNKRIKEISERNDEEMKEIRRKCESETNQAIIKEEQKAASLLTSIREECESKIKEAQNRSLLKQKSSEIEHQAEIRELIQKHETERELLASQYQEELKHQIEEEKKKWTKEFEIQINELKNRQIEELKKLHFDNLSDCSRADVKVSRLQSKLTVLEETLEKEKSKREDDLKAAMENYKEAVDNFDAERTMYEEKCKQHDRVEIALKKELEETKKNLLDWEERCKSLEADGSRKKLAKNQSNQECIALEPKLTANKGISAVCCLNEGRKSDNMMEKGKCQSVILPTHSKTVTHHEYEVATSDGKKTITRKRTKSTVMIESPLDAKRPGRRKSTRISSQHKKAKPSRVYAMTMGDLFGGKSLDPYSDDPYAFN